jgi:homoserine dehydrogenase
MRTIAIGLLGAGNVGGGVLRILEENRDAIERRLAARLKVHAVAVRDVGRQRHVDVPIDLITDDASAVVADEEVRVVVELIGGIEPARTLVLDALRRGKHVVTANKALLATHGRELFAEAAKHRVNLHFEGAVAGGIPILRTLREGLASDRIVGVRAIVNGTSNYILDSMTRAGLDYDAALSQAQRAGYAEADPALDVGGQDAAQKLALMALLAFGLRVDPIQIPTEGITRVRPFDIAAARELGYVVKSLAVARQTDDGLVLGVHPAFVPQDSILAGVHGAFNAVLVESQALGPSLYFGRGAGMMPTGMAVVSDLVEVCRAVLSPTEGPPPQAFAVIHDAAPLSVDDETCENYLCMHVPNLPGILGRVATCLGRHQVSIKTLKQDPQGVGEPVDMIIRTESVRERNLQAALAEIDSLPDVLAPTHRFRICPPDPLD